MLITALLAIGAVVASTDRADAGEPTPRQPLTIGDVKTLYTKAGQEQQLPRYIIGGPNYLHLRVPSSATTVYVHRCGHPPSETDPAALVAVGGGGANVVMVPEPDACVTTTDDVSIIVSWLISAIGRFTPATGADEAPMTVQVGAGGLTPVDLPTGPAGSVGVALLVEASATEDTFVTVGRCSDPLIAGRNAPITINDSAVTHTGMVTHPDDGDQCVYNRGGDASVTLRVTGWFDGGGPTSPDDAPMVSFRPVEAYGFHAQAPQRLLDTRRNGERLERNGVARLSFAPGHRAVALNVTVSETGGDGYVSVWPCASARPTVSNLNFVTGDEVANAVLATVDPNGDVCFFASAPTELIVDQSGWYGADGAPYTPVSPERVVDSRNGLAASGPLGPSGPTPTQLSVPMAGAHVPETATAVTLNLTATESATPGFAVAWPCGTPRPNASNVNFGVDDTVPNLVTVPLGADGSACFFASADTHVIADLQGWYGPDGEARYEPLVPQRLFDTRTEGPLSTNIYKGPRVVPVGRILETAAVAAVLNTTATETTGDGYATVYPCTSPSPNPAMPNSGNFDRPNSSNLNFSAGDTVANLVVTRLGEKYEACFYAHRPTHLIADLSGAFVTGPIGSTPQIGVNAYLD